MTLLLLLLMQSCLQAPTVENKKEKSASRFSDCGELLSDKLYHNNHIEINSAGSVFLSSKMAPSKFTLFWDCMSK